MAYQVTKNNFRLLSSADARVAVQMALAILVREWSQASLANATQSESSIRAQGGEKRAVGMPALYADPRCAMVVELLQVIALGVLKPYTLNLKP